MIGPLVYSLIYEAAFAKTANDKQVRSNSLSSSIISFSNVFHHLLWAMDSQQGLSDSDVQDVHELSDSGNLLTQTCGMVI